MPDECESLGRMLQLPDAPFLPDHLRGRSFVLVEVAFIGTASDGAALVQPLRDLGPEFDTIAMMPTSELSVVNMDPDTPLPYTGDGILLDGPASRGDRRDGRGVRRITAPACRGSSPGWGRRHPFAGSRRARFDRSTVRRLHVRARPGSGRVCGSRSPRGARAQSAWAVGQRPEVPELRGVTRRFAVDLPGRELRPVQARQGAIRPDRLVPREPRDLRRRAASPAGRRCRRPTRAGPCCA